MLVVRLRGRGDVETNQRPLSCHLVEQILQSRHGSVAQPAPPLHSLGKTAGDEQQETFHPTVSWTTGVNKGDVLREREIYFIVRLNTI